MRLEEALQGINSALSSVDLQIVFDGNSLMEGQNNSSIDQYIQTRLDAYFIPLVNSYTSASFGASGQSIVDMNSDAATQVDPLLDTGKDSWVVFGEGENGILADGRTSAQNLTDIQTYYDARKAAGWDNVILILFPYAKNENNEGLYSGDRALWNWVTQEFVTPSPITWAEARYDDRKSYTEAVQASPSTYCDFLIDLTANAYLGGIQYALRDNTYHSDYLHFQTAGYDLIIQEIKQIIISN